MALKPRVEHLANNFNAVYRRYADDEKVRKALNEAIGSLMVSLKIKKDGDREDFMILCTRQQLTLFGVKSCKPDKLPLGCK